MPVINGIGVLVVVDGNPLPEYKVDDVYCVAGNPGDSFVLQLVCPLDPAAVFAAMIEKDGKEAIIPNSSGSYVPFRRKTDDPAECDLQGPLDGTNQPFRFSNTRSVSDPRNTDVGVIRVTIYDNAAEPPVACSQDMRSGLQSTSPAYENMPPYELGRPIRVITINYASAKDLPGLAQ